VGCLQLWLLCFQIGRYLSLSCFSQPSNGRLINVELALHQDALIVSVEQIYTRIDPQFVIFGEDLKIGGLNTFQP
jgi:hypothetical protein